MNNKKYALALGSGGVKGFVHIGVLKALEELEIEITHIGGTSAGSLIAAIYALEKDAKKIEDMALKIDNKKISSLFSRYINTSFRKARDPLLFFIKNYVDDKKFDNCKIPFVAVSVDLQSGEKIFHTNGYLKDAIRASCSVPYLFGPYKYKDKLLVDGGYANSIPVDAVKNIGGDKVIGVNLQSYIPRKSNKKSFLRTQTSTYKATLYNVAKSNMDLAEKKLTFDIEEFSIRDILKERQKFIDMGYTETMKLFDK